ncbi:hypothetical protein [Spartinivicinus ruber]|uniref:hypothetical protein n=1 Tax=Spartinivicinus ruber TaxID=2683272 RepID=UPI0013D3B537|nr:hypothetical protein [Spartinivicinus ruber]
MTIKKYCVCQAFAWRQGWTVPNEILELTDCEAQQLLRTGHIKHYLPPKPTTKKEKVNATNH